MRQWIMATMSVFALSFGPNLTAMAGCGCDTCSCEDCSCPDCGSCPDCA